MIPKKPGQALLNQILTAAQLHTRHVDETVVAQRSIAEIPRDVCTIMHCCSFLFFNSKH